MAESTLTLGLTDLQGDVGLFLGWGSGPNNGDVVWTNYQQRIIDTCVKSGLRQFYFPPPKEGEAGSYDWSFLRPVAVLVLPVNQSTVDLPDDFGSPEEGITILSQTGQVPWTIQFTGIGRVNEAYAAQPVITGRPLLAAITPKKATHLHDGQRFSLVVFPLADQNYNLQFAYYLNSDYLTTGNPFALGGMPHVETIREACLMAAENFLDDGAQVHQMKFMERLAASISLDRRSKPASLGYNRDRSDWRWLLNRQDQHGLSLVRVNGVLY